ncbi:MAG: Na(+)-translocating NADH-quinone reductase subunit A [Aquimonas sp.]|nr:Na(+)-translocating NADH-quinone reductase subunit A [Aquimonas sp.]
MIRIKRGLDLPLAGAPEPRIDDSAPAIRRVAVLGGDYPGMRPGMAVAEGDRVRRGQLIFEDKKTPGVRFTAPGAGVVRAIHRGDRRFMLSVEIELEGDEDESFERFDRASLGSLPADTVREQLVVSGEWTAIRTRPFGKVPQLDARPAAIFVPLIDTQPLAADPELIVAEREQDFRDGLALLSRLTEGTVWVCRREGGALASFAAGRVREETFAGPHPAGNPGTHIHFLEPVGARKSVWVVGYQDVIAFGRLFTTGRLHSERVVALGGPGVKQPRLLRTRVGASLEELTRDRLDSDRHRIISGSVFNGRAASGPTAFLGRLANQVSVLREGDDRPLLGYLSPGIERHSVLNIYLSRFLPGRRLALSTTTNGSERAMVPLGQYESVMPLDILPTQLLRALAVGDTEAAQALGALELVEEDLALCSYVCAGKYEYGPILRDNLDQIEAEG